MRHSLYHKHILSIAELTRQELEDIVQLAQQLKQTPQPDVLKNKVVASCFFEASTRTRLSFETAIQRLGGSVIGFDDAGNTSLANKGETLSDSIQVISNYVDALVMRHPREGAARLASEFSHGVPIINAGDGANQHPSQTLLDLFTIFETQGRLDNLTVAFVGDLKYGRTVHSLTQALAKFEGIRFVFISPPSLAMPDYLLEELDALGLPYQIEHNLEAVIPKLDILYMTRVQKERFDPSEYAHMKADFVLNAAMLKQAQPHLKVLHPLPRVDEITTDVDNTPHAYYFQQAGNGLYARQALLHLVLNDC